MKTATQAWRQLLALGALTLGLVNAAHAGSWSVSHVETANYTKQEINIGNGDDTDSRVKSTKIAKRISAQGAVTTITTNGETETRQGGYDIDGPQLGWHGGYDQGQTYHGAASGKASGKRNVHAVFRWKRDNLEGTETPDPDDNPPPLLYFLEHASVSGSESIHHSAYFGMGYSAEHPFKGTQFSFTGVTNPLGGDFVFRGFSSDYASDFYSSNGSKVTCIAVKGREEVPGPDRSFSGGIDLNTSYLGLQFPYDKIADASLEFSYSVEVADFQFGAFGLTFQAVPLVNQKNKAEITYDAFVDRSSEIISTDQPGDPVRLRRFWSGSAIYQAGAKIYHGLDSADVYSPQNYEWSHSGAGAPLPVPADVTGLARDFRELPPSTSTKILTHDLGDFTAETFAATAGQFPKTSVIKAKINGGAGTSSPFKGTASVNWHVHYMTVYKIALNFQLIGPHGEIIDLSQLPQGDVFTDDPDWGDVIWFTNFEHASPRLFASTTHDGFKGIGIAIVQGVPLALGGEFAIAGRTLTTTEVGAGFLTKVAPAFESFLASLNEARVAQNLVPLAAILAAKATNQGSFGRSEFPLVPTPPANWLSPFAGGGEAPPPLNPGLQPGDIPTEVPNDPPDQIPQPPDDWAPPTDTPGWNEPTGTPGGDHIPPPPPWTEPTGTTTVVNIPFPAPDPAPNPAPTPTSTPPPPPTPITKWLYTENPGTWINDFDGTINGGSPIQGSGDRWLEGTGHNNEHWKTGYYFTDLSPRDIGRLNLTEGELSFKMFGHPYNWSRPVYALKIGFNGGINSHLYTVRHAGPAQFIYRVPDYGTLLTLGYRDLSRTPDQDGLPDLSGLPLVFRPGAPGANDVPAGNINNTPKNGGSWRGGDANRGEGIWDSTKTEVREMDAQVHQTSPIPSSVPVTFHRNYPDFSPWIIANGQITLPFQHGTQRNGTATTPQYDFDESDTRIAPSLLANYANDALNPFVVAPGTTLLKTVQDWRQNYRFRDPITGQSVLRPLTWHHLEDMRTMLLVPGPGLNNPALGGIPHMGSAKRADVARW